MGAAGFLDESLLWGLGRVGGCDRMNMGLKKRRRKNT